MDLGRTRTRLNPCFNGKRRILGVFFLTVAVQTVLILVIMEKGGSVRAVVHRHLDGLVLILVLMEKGGSTISDMILALPDQS